MGYIERNLSSQERIIKRAVVSYRYVFRVTLICQVVFMAMVYLTPETGPASIAMIVVGSALNAAFFTFPILIWRFLRRLTTELVLTNRRIIIKWGILSQSVAQIGIDQIRSMMATQGWLERLLNYGKVVIRGADGVVLCCSYINHPHQFLQSVDQQIQRSRSALKTVPLLSERCSDQN